MDADDTFHSRNEIVHRLLRVNCWKGCLAELKFNEMTDALIFVELTEDKNFVYLLDSGLLCFSMRFKLLANTLNNFKENVSICMGTCNRLLKINTTGNS